MGRDRPRIQVFPWNGQLGWVLNWLVTKTQHWVSSCLWQSCDNQKVAGWGLETDTWTPAGEIARPSGFPILWTQGEALGEIMGKARARIV